jgi:predicted RNA-binding Zn ribbon-like protein
LSLDFAETGGKSEERAVWERLHGPSDLSDWLSESPLQIEGASVTPAEFETALDLREAIWYAAQAIRQGGMPLSGDIDLINQAASMPDPAPQLNADSQTRAWKAPLTATAALSAVARDAIDLFSGELRDRIRECENPKCSLIFVDTSRPGKRRWCHMDRCGNMAKTARYRQRRG